MTDAKKTIIDCFDLPQYSGGYDELIRAFNQANLNSEKMIGYCKAIKNIAITKRMGYLAELLNKKGMKSFINFALKEVNEKYNLFDSFGIEEGEFANKWRLRKLFKDNKLLGNIDNFLKIFIPAPQLENVNIEKGTLTTNSINFATGSVFNFVENTFLNDSDYLVCDDLGKEWADHISISRPKIKFIHSKYKNANFSASAFKDIVSQVLKNLGNLMPQDFQLASKQNFWNSSYNNDGFQT